MESEGLVTTIDSLKKMIDEIRARNAQRKMQEKKPWRMIPTTYKFQALTLVTNFFYQVISGLRLIFLTLSLT